MMDHKFQDTTKNFKIGGVLNILVFLLGRRTL